MNEQMNNVCRKRDRGEPGHGRPNQKILTPDRQAWRFERVRLMEARGRERTEVDRGQAYTAIWRRAGLFCVWHRVFALPGMG
jgi:hypothetical protein